MMMNKTLNFFKLSSLALLAMGLFTFGTCSDDDEEEAGNGRTKEGVRKVKDVTGEEGEEGRRKRPTIKRGPAKSADAKRN